MGFLMCKISYWCSFCGFSIWFDVLVLCLVSRWIDIVMDELCVKRNFKRVMDEDLGRFKDMM